MSTIFHAHFDVFIAKYILFRLFLLFLIKNCNFLQVIKLPYPRNRFLVNLRSYFSTYKFFPGQGRYFLLAHSKTIILTKK